MENNKEPLLYRWVKASERLPEEGGWYFIMLGIDKTLWTRSKLVARTEMLKQHKAENKIEWLEPYTPPVEDREGELINTIQDLLIALDGLLNHNTGHGCPMCDNGKLRRPEKEHWDDCVWNNARKIFDNYKKISL